jgi:hypothetical protein
MEVANQSIARSIMYHLDVRATRNGISQGKLLCLLLASSKTLVAGYCVCRIVSYIHVLPRFFPAVTCLHGPRMVMYQLYSLRESALKREEMHPDP